MTGTIKKVITEKGFGFINGPEGVEYFFHQSGVDRAVFETLQPGDGVQFTVEPSAKGPRATDVRRG